MTEDVLFPRFCSQAAWGSPAEEAKLHVGMTDVRGWRSFRLGLAFAEPQVKKRHFAFVDWLNNRIPLSLP